MHELTSKMESTALTSMPLRGTKRKSAIDAKQSIKKVRPTPSSADSDSEDAYQSSDSSQDSEDQSESHGVTTSTPLSPMSAKASPRFPSQLKTIQCPHEGCDKSFNRPARLQEHLRSHTNTRIFVCSHESCDKDFLRETHLNHHIKSAHTDVRDYTCKYKDCGKSFVTNTRLKRHLAAHEGREKYQCTEIGCEQTFRKHATLQRHTVTIHEGKAAFICEEVGEGGDKCGAGFDTAGKLRTHNGREHGSEHYRCIICEGEGQGMGDQIGFSTFSDLQMHNKTVHPPTCAECKLPCSSARELTQHVEIHHGGQNLNERQIHLCPDPSCGKGFTKKGNLNIHIRSVHKGEKPFVCGKIPITKLNNISGWNASDACGRGFAAKVNLEEHIRTAHLGLEHSRKENNKGGRTSKQGPSLVGLLSGTAYDEDPDRTVPCLIAGCHFLFTRNYDRELHLRARHGLSNLEVHRLQVASATEGTFVKIEPGEPMEVAQEEWNPDLGGGDQFWLGGNEETAEDEWDADEAGMRMLIGEDENDEMVIDPVLRG